MSEFQNESLATPDVTQHPAASTDNKNSSGVSKARSYRVGDKIVRIDAANINASLTPHIVPPSTIVHPSPQPDDNGAVPAWNEAVGVVDTTDAISVRKSTVDVIQENDRAIHDAAQEMAALAKANQAVESIEDERSKVEPVLGPLKIQPAWEVEYFRWPRLTRRLLTTHPVLFEQIGTQILTDLQPTRSRIGVCSTFQREGKTTIATCLARWAATSGKRTLLIDADIERPRMTVMCGLSHSFGWQSILDSEMPASETMIRSIESDLVFMPSRSDDSPPLENKSLDRLANVTFQMKYEFDVVIIDMGTIDNICAHGTRNMDVVDAMLVTRDPAQVSVGQVMDTRRVLNNLGIAKTYVAQNFARRSVA